ncbi:MAG: adenosine deaminase family protein [Candidatus Eiseniibacteriota bacterium]
MARDFIALPKAEVHVHLEGCFEAHDVVRLAAAGEALPRPPERLFTVDSGLAEFLGLLDWICGLVRTREQLVALAGNFSRRMAASGADRIDHGVRAIEDPVLVERLAERRIPLGICPTSNVALGVCKSYDEHPIERLRRAGVPVSINTDDPALLGTRLEREYAHCVEAFGWSDTEIRGVARTSIEASFADAPVKQRLLDALEGW